MPDRLANSQFIDSVNQRHGCLLAYCLMLVVLSGCGDGHQATVTGVADLEGTPLETGMVTFHPASGGASAYGVLGTGGRYEIKTGSKQGLKPGKYHVTVKATEPYVESPRGGTPAIPKTLSPPRYSDVKTTTLIVAVESGSNKIPLALTKSEPSE